MAVPYGQLLKSCGSAPEVEIKPEDDADIIYTRRAPLDAERCGPDRRHQTGLWPVARQRLGSHRLHYGYMKHQTPFPFFTSTGVSFHIMTWLWYGYYLIWQPVFDAVQSIKLIQREKTTSICLAPTMIIFIMQHPQFKEFDMSSLRIMSYGGSAMPEEPGPGKFHPPETG